MILKYYGHKILKKHSNTAKQSNNLASAVYLDGAIDSWAS